MSLWIGYHYKSLTCSSHLSICIPSINPLFCYLPVSPGSVCDRRPDQHVTPMDPPPMVFCKQAATQLPPHRPWNCAIDLLPGYKLPKGRVYPLSIPERKAMEEYIQKALNQGYIRPSSSPAASSFFFVGKKDGGLRPCIDYRAVNSQTVKLPYPLPLVPAALEKPRGAASSLSWTCEALTTSFGSGKAMSGRRHSLLLSATMNIS